jgi:molybdate transport system substrate-binding protein
MAHEDLPVIPSDRSDDLHGLEIADTADLTVFLAGNQFMAAAELMAAFQKLHPEVTRIFYETLPPGLELKQILAGGSRFGEAILTGRADVYTSVNEGSMKTLEAAGRIPAGGYWRYLGNRLTLMVPAGNPAGIRTVADLGGEAVRISQPDPANEDIGGHIVEMYRRAGGEALVRRIMEEKRAEGTTIYTTVHHRETPIHIRKGTVDVGPVWATEVIHARAEGLAVDEVAPGPDLDGRDRIGYYSCVLADAPHPENAARFEAFLASETAAGIYARYGFLPVR